MKFVTVTLLCVLMARQAFGVVLGGDCTSNDECTSTNPTSACTGGKCVCATGYTQEGTACKANVDQSCTENADCVDSTNGACTGADGSKTCTCNTNYIANDDKTKCLGKVDQSCTANADCLKYGSCTGADSSKTCTCNTNYMANGDKTRCLGKVGQACTANADCTSMATCTSGKCACMANYVDNAGMCKKAVGQACTANTDCTSMATCTSDKCACMANYVDNMGMCKKAVDQTCTATSECTMNAECSGDPKKCMCKSGYKKDDNNKCMHDGASVTMVSVSLLVFSAVFSLLM